MYMSKSSPEFINYVKTPLTPQVVQTVFNSNGVTYEKTKLFGDFIKSLMVRIFTTYIESSENKLYTIKEQQANHFTWCWRRTVSDFNNEGVIFHNDSLVRDYFRDVVFKSFYTFEDKSPNSKLVKHSMNLWFRLFQYDGVKTQMDVDGFLDIYALFNDSLRGKVGKRLDL